MKLLISIFLMSSNIVLSGEFYPHEITCKKEGETILKTEVYIEYDDSISSLSLFQNEREHKLIENSSDDELQGFVRKIVDIENGVFVLTGEIKNIGSIDFYAIPKSLSLDAKNSFHFKANFDSTVYENKSNGDRQFEFVFGEEVDCTASYQG